MVLPLATPAPFPSSSNQLVVPENVNRNKMIPFPPFVELVRRAMPAHYEAYNKEIYFSNMFIADSFLKDKTFQLIMYVADVLSVSVTYRVRPLIPKYVLDVLAFIRYKILTDNWRTRILREVEEK